jgi:Flp pilus assembly protein CpaB
MRRPRILILFALILLLGAAAAYFLLSGGGGGEPEEPQATPEFASDVVFVAIAAQDIARGADIPEDGIVMSRMPANMVVETMISGPDEEGIRTRVIGKIARQDIGRGVPITEAMLTDQTGDLLAGGSDASLAIPPGYTAISVPMSRLTGVAYAIQTGDVVDVIISLMFVDVDPDFQSILPNFVTAISAPGGTAEFPSPSLTGEVQPVTINDEDSSGDFFPLGKIVEEERTGQPFHVIPQEDQRPRIVTQRIVDSARVLHVGTFPLDGAQLSAQPTPAPEEGVGAPPPQEGQAVQQQTEKPDIITLIVTPQDALALNWAMKVGAHLTFTLRAPNDSEVTETTSVTLQYLIDNYNVTIPTKLPYQLEPRVDELLTPQLSNDKPASQPQQ